MANADLVVTMGGYNTLCEILSLRKPALVIPRDKPRQEQLLRAQVFRGRGLCDFIKWSDVSPELLRHKVNALLEDPGSCVADLEVFRMTGLEVMCERLPISERTARDITPERENPRHGAQGVSPNFRDVHLQ